MNTEPKSEVKPVNKLYIAFFVVSIATILIGDYLDKCNEVGKGAGMGDYQMVKDAIDRGCGSDIKRLNSALDSSKSVRVTKLLVKEGADPNIILFRAVRRNNYQMTKFLLENGADVNKWYTYNKWYFFNEEVIKCLDYAKMKNYKSIEKLLREHGAKD